MRPRQIMPRWKLRMIHDMIVSNKFTVKDMAGEAECNEDLIVEICHLLQILAIRESENPPPPTPTVTLKVVYSDQLRVPSISVSTTSAIVNIRLGSNTALLLEGETPTERDGA